MTLWVPGSLNVEQERVVVDDSLIILQACPGSGKTRTLAHKIVWELARIQSHREFVVAITYTNRAANEIQLRIESLGISTEQLWIGTIHSFCLEWVVRPYQGLNRWTKTGFRIIDPITSDELKEQIAIGFGLSADYVRYRINWGFDSKGMREPRLLANGESNVHYEVCEKYYKELFMNHQLDFDLILKTAHHLLLSEDSISNNLSNLFACILVDEYQDTQELQYRILCEVLKNSRTRTLLVGDPNQQIYHNMGGHAVSKSEMEKWSNCKFELKNLEKNYRSSQRIVDYFRHFQSVGSNVVAAGNNKNETGTIKYFNQEIDRESLVAEIANIIRSHLQTGVTENQIAVVGPQWVFLASMTRGLMTELPDATFDGPGMVPFARNPDNIWYKVARIALTTASPELFVRRMRWAKEVVQLLNDYLPRELSARQLLRICNSIVITEANGLEYLADFFRMLLQNLGISLEKSNFLNEQFEGFFKSSEQRLNRISRDGEKHLEHIDNFRRVFRPRSGITVSTIHGVKGAEFDVVIAFGLLEGLVPHRSDDDSESAKRLIYVIASRARDHLYLISEKGRKRSRGREDYIPTDVLNDLDFDYDDLENES